MVVPLSQLPALDLFDIDTQRQSQESATQMPTSDMFLLRVGKRADIARSIKLSRWVCGDSDAAELIYLCTLYLYLLLAL